MAETTITVDGKVLSRVYAGASVKDAAQYLLPYPEVFIVCDRHVVSYAKIVEDGLAHAGNFKGTLVIEATEEKKTMDTVLKICAFLLSRGASRKAMVFAIGGGITTDMAGFAASIYKRGCRFAYLPTTLLSQVDAAIGGKTGVNYESLKNMLGVIRQPDFTFECPEVLETLPYRDFVSGTAELLKTFIIDDSANLYGKTVNVLSQINNASDKAAAIKENRDALVQMIEAAAAVKAGVVSRDQFECGERRKLNLGHTFAHAIEHEARVKNVDIAHGEAVAMGMVLAARLSEKAGMAELGLESLIKENLKVCGLPVESPFPVETLAAAMKLDKKAETGGRIHFVLIAKIGDVEMKDMTVEEAEALLK
ncbi:MAG: 3-dehydroquinate synthase [Bacteroidales bacterium]|nr:3-dehydroquinate synthase [Bacteroidales bacterium]